MDHEFFMRRALELAERGRGFTHPNPLVGAVLVKDGRIIGEGWHQRFGGPHAEVNAVTSAAEPVAGATIYCTLEPCSHFGKTPPCAELLISREIAKVVFAMPDPHRLSGGGRARLEAAGIEVESGVCESEARAINRAWLRFIETGLPYVTWKFAQTLDGALTLVPGTETRISGDAARDYVDALRAGSDGIAVGVETVITDDPSLRVRGEATRAPYRIVFDTNFRTPTSAQLIANNQDRRTILITGPNITPIEGVQIISVGRTGDRIDLKEAMKRLAEIGIIDILLESGRALGNAMLAEGLVQRMIVLQSPRTLGGAKGTFRTIDSIGEDARMVIDL